MGQFTLVRLAAYTIDVDPASRPQHSWDAFWFVRAVKGDPVNARVQVPVTHRFETLEQANARKSYDWCAEMANDRLAILKVDPVCVIPVPPSALTVGAPLSGIPWELAARIAKYGGIPALDCLRWSSPLQSARKGGPREPSVLFNYLTVVNRPPAGTCILIDDVTTSGGHFQACAAKLREAGCPVEAAVAAGQTMRGEIAKDSFNLPDEAVIEFEPGPTWA